MSIPTLSCSRAASRSSGSWARSPRQRSSRSSPPTCRHRPARAAARRGIDGRTRSSTSKSASRARPLSPTGDPPGPFGPSTRAAVEAFQRHRGPAHRRDRGRSTWDRLVEAGRRLGDRVLSDDRPAAARRRRRRAPGAPRRAGLRPRPRRRHLRGADEGGGGGLPARRGPALRRGGRSGDARRAATPRRAAPPLDARERGEGAHRARRQGPSTRLVVALGLPAGLDALVEPSARALRGRGARPSSCASPTRAPSPRRRTPRRRRCLVVLRLDPGRRRRRRCTSRRIAASRPSGRRLAEPWPQRAGRALGVAGDEGMTLPVLRESRMPAIRRSKWAPWTGSSSAPASWPRRRARPRGVGRCPG